MTKQLRFGVSFLTLILAGSFAMAVFVQNSPDGTPFKVHACGQICSSFLKF